MHIPVTKVSIYLVALFFNLANVTAFAQTETAVISLYGIGDLKTGITSSQLEKLIHSPIKKLNNSFDTIHCIYKGIDLDICLEQGEFKIYTVDDIICNNVKIKTSSGIGIGDDPLKIFNACKNLFFCQSPQTATAFSSITIYKPGESWFQIIFSLRNNKVEKIRIHKVTDD